MSDPLRFLMLIACAVPVILLSLTLHEWGHAFAAHLCGDDTTKNLGRMTLNPFAHIDAKGFLLLLLVGFGWAKPVPVNPRNYRRYRLGEAVVSLAGVTMNLLLAIVFSGFFLLRYWLLFHHPAEWLESEALSTVILYGIVINISLFFFNLLPIFPLDGYHIFELLFARRLPFSVFNFLRRYGQFILIGLLLLFRLIGFSPISELIDLYLGWLIRLAIQIL